MAKKKVKPQEYMVRCRISGTATVFVTAKDEVEAVQKAEKSEYDSSDIDDWFIVEAQDVELNE